MIFPEEWLSYDKISELDTIVRSSVQKKTSLPYTYKDVAIPGVSETGLFIGMAEKAYFGQEDGTFQ